MAQVPATSYESTSLGDVAEFTIPFPFLSRAEVFVTVDGAAAPFTWINDGLVQLAEVPELGAIVRRYRSTEAYVPLHQFSQGVPFLPRYVDRDFKQTLYAVQESVNDTAGTAAQALAIAEESLVLVQDAFDILVERTQYMDLGPYAAGLEFQTTSQVFSYNPGTGAEFYAPGPSITLPYTTTGAGAGEIANFRSVGDAILRSDLADDADPSKGAELVGFSSETVYSALTRALASNTLDTTRIDVPSADTVNLTNSAPNTRHINITGTTGITSFTMAAGRCYFVRFAGTLTLTNNASIVTQSGANITTAAGDTCIVRATAANVVEVLAYTSVGSLDSYRVDVASVAVVNLTTSAPNTRHINITGTTAITSFTVAVGRCYFVRFNAALTLTNGAGLVTQTGANITTSAGDTCIIRATAANVVEVLAYTPFKNQAVGYGQTWQNVTGSRALATVYTNSTGKPIQLSVQLSVSAGGAGGLRINGTLVAESGQGTVNNQGYCFAHVIPNGATYEVYQVNVPAISIAKWWELR